MNSQADVQDNSQLAITEESCYSEKIQNHSMIPEFPQFKKLELSDREHVRSFTSKYPPYSDFNFVSMYSWDTKGEMELSILNNNLVVRFTDYINGQPFFSFLGDNEVNATVQKLIDYSCDLGLPCELKLVPEVSIKGLDEKKFKAIEDRDHFDYVLSVDKLKPHDGTTRKLSSRRKLVNKLKQLNELSVVPISLDDPKIVDEILRVFSSWETQRGISIEDTKHLKIAIEKAFKLGDFKDTISLGVFAKDRLVGYSVNEVVGDGYALGHFQQADLEYSSGIYALLMQEVAVYLNELECKYINLEQDLGIEGLKKWKLSYTSTDFLRKYSVTLNS